MTKLPLSLLCVCTAAALTSACATQPTRPSTREERLARAKELFASFDLDGDGYLTKTELDGGVRYLAMGDTPNLNSEVMLGLKAQANKKKPGKPKNPSRTLTTQEITKAVENAFQTQDADLDQRLSQEEFKKLIVERSTLPGDSDPWEPLM